MFIFLLLNFEHLLCNLDFIFFWTCNLHVFFKDMPYILDYLQLYFEKCLQF